MAEEKWKDSLRRCFENLRILERCMGEVLQSFDHFCEFVAEPAFEDLSAEFKEYRIKTKHDREKGRSTSFEIKFPESPAVNFLYTISLPKNSVELKLKLKIQGRKRPKGPIVEKEEPFMPSVAPENVLKLSKEDLIEDIIEHYKNFNYEALTAPD